MTHLPTEVAADIAALERDLIRKRYETCLAKLQELEDESGVLPPVDDVRVRHWWRELDAVQRTAKAKGVEL